MISNGFKAVAGYFGWAKSRTEEANAPDIKAAAEAKQEQKQIDGINQDVATGNINEIRKDIAE